MSESPIHPHTGGDAVVDVLEAAGVEVVFGRSELFSFVEEDALRRMLGEMMTGKTVH